MIGRLRGRYIDRDGLDVLVECGGVGYEVSVSTHTLTALGATGGEVTLRVFTHAQENKIALYGFSSAEERALFDLLITVKNVGPSSALKILSAGAGPYEIARMIATESLSQLTSIKGVGKKTAEMLIVELRGKCDELLIGWGHGADAVAAQAPRSDARHPMLGDVASALSQLGWRPSEVDKAVAGLEVETGATLESLLRQALRHAVQTMSR